MKRVFLVRWRALVAAGAALGQGSTPATVRPYLWNAERPKSEIGEINVFRRFSNERTAQMREFYGEVLALPVLPETALGGGADDSLPRRLLRGEVVPEPAVTGQHGGLDGLSRACGS